MPFYVTASKLFQSAWGQGVWGAEGRRISSMVRNFGALWSKGGG